MGKLLWTIVCLLLYVGSVEAQVTSNTINARVDDGIGNKITSTVAAAKRGLDINCIAGCTAGGGGTQDINVLQILGAAPSATNTLPGRLSTGAAYYDARDRNWTLASGTDSVAAVQSGTWNIGSVTNLDVLLSTRSSEATLANVLTTAAFQARINTLGQKTMANSTPFVIASDQTSIPVAATVSNSFLLDATFTGRINTFGQKAMAASTPVVIASDQVAFPVTVSSGSITVSNAYLLDATYTGRMPAGASPGDNESNTNTSLSRIGTFPFVWDAGGGNWDRWTGAVTVTSGAITVSNSFLLDATFTARINTLGQKTMANSTPVVLPSDQAAIPVTVLSTVASANNDGACTSGAANFTALASNGSRTWAAIWASPANTDDVYIKLGATATNADARFAPGQALNLTSGRIYTGIIDAFPNSGTQAVCVMELN